jgi:hypothetical protein
MIAKEWQNALSQVVFPGQHIDKLRFHEKMKIGSIPTKIPSVKTVVSSIDNLLQRCRENDRKENIIYGSGFIVDRRHEITDKWMS